MPAEVGIFSDGSFGSITLKNYFNYKMQITLLKSYSVAFSKYFGNQCQNTKYIFRK